MNDKTGKCKISDFRRGTFRAFFSASVLKIGSRKQKIIAFFTQKITAKNHQDTANCSTETALNGYSDLRKDENYETWAVTNSNLNCFKSSKITPFTIIFWTFTIIELLIVISIIAILASMLLPALNKAKQATYGITCINNLRSMGPAFINYTNDNNEYIM